MQISILPGSPKSVSVTLHTLADHHDSEMARKIRWLISENQPMDRVCANFQRPKIAVTHLSKRSESRQSAQRCDNKQQTT